MKKVFSLSLLAVLAWIPAFAGQVSGTKGGDGDPFPVACSNFSGMWRSDQNHTYLIGQKSCSWLQIRKTEGGENVSLTIVPDGVRRTAFGAEWKGTVRHRWNSEDFGAVVETYRTMIFSEKTVTEFVTLEEVNENLILENTYRVIEGHGDGSTPLYEYNQQVFRRDNSSTKPRKGE